MPAVSVVIPSYNHAAYLRECIESVIWQSFQDWELIIVDDVSSDDSVAVAKRFTDPRIRVIENESNLGTYATENVGIDHSSGDWIAILNSDDVWLPRKLESQILLLQKHPQCTFSYTGSQLMDEEGDKIAKGDGFHSDYPEGELQELLPYLLFENRVLASSLLFKRGAARFNGKLKYSGDWVALLQLAMLGPCAFVKEPLTVWRQHPENNYKQVLKVLPEEVAVREAILAKSDLWLSIAKDVPETKHRLSQCAVALSALYVRARQMTRARQTARLARQFDPNNPRAKTLRVLFRLVDTVGRRQFWRSADKLVLTPHLSVEEVLADLNTQEYP